MNPYSEINIIGNFSLIDSLKKQVPSIKFKILTLIIAYYIMIYCSKLLDQFIFKINHMNSRNKTTFYLLFVNNKYMFIPSPTNVLISASNTKINFDLFTRYIV